MKNNVLKIETERMLLNEAISFMFEANRKVKELYPPKELGNAAKEIIKMTNDNGIYIYKDESLMEHLRRLDRLENLPQHLLPAIAEVFARMYMLKKENRLIN